MRDHARPGEPAVTGRPTSRVSRVRAMVALALVACCAFGALAFAVIAFGGPPAAAAPSPAVPPTAAGPAADTPAPSAPDPTDGDSPTSGPDDSGSGTPTPSATPTGTAGTPGSPSPEPTASAAPSSPTASPATASPVAPSEQPTASAPGQQSPAPSRAPARPGTTPALQSADVSWATGLVAVAVLAAAALVLWLVARTGPEPAAPTPPPPTSPEPGTTALLVELGEALVDAGYAVPEVQDVLLRVASAHGAPGGQVLAFPTALLVSVPGEGAVETEVSAAGASTLRLEQTDAVAHAAADAAAGRGTPAQCLQELARIRSMPPAYPPRWRLLGYGGLSVGLALILGGSGTDLVLAAALGAIVGGGLLLTRTASAAVRAVLPFGSAFLVAIVVFLLGRTDLDLGVLAPLVAPLVTLLPGALLTTSVIELATGQLISGAGRLAGGVMQLVLLALGIVAAAQLVGVPAGDLDSLAAQPLGPLAPWIGVAVFGVGLAVHQCAPRSTIRWILLVLYVAYAAQVIGGVFFGAVLSAFVGALVMTPVAAYVARRPTGPATQVSFLPAFWLLVPGSLGLVGVTKLLSDDRVDALGVLATTGTTMVAISFGVLIGRALVGALPRRVTRLRPAGR